MIFFDIETLGTESTSVVLSIGAVYIASNDEPISWDRTIHEGVFIKFDAKEQIERYNRVMLKSTLDWWLKQGEVQQRCSVKPSKDDLSVKAGLDAFHKWFRAIPNWKEELVWVRGGLDQMCYESLCRAAEIEPVVPYNQYRDVRTALQCLYPEHEKNGYIGVDVTMVPDFSRDKVVKHHPVHDSLFDACMLLFPDLDPKPLDN